MPVLASVSAVVHVMSRPSESEHQCIVLDKTERAHYQFAHVGLALDQCFGALLVAMQASEHVGSDAWSFHVTLAVCFVLGVCLCLD